MSFEGSKPLSIKLSAPGKIILFGEYSVVFNKPAISATLSLRTNLRLLENNSDIIRVKFSSLSLDKSFPLKSVREHFNIPTANNWQAYLNSLTETLELTYEKTFSSSDLTEASKLSLVAFFHCFSKFFKSSNGFLLEIDSELSLGSGIGSSASFSVVLSTAALLYENYLKNKENLKNLIKRNENGDIIVIEKFQDQISELAFSCEKIFHGSPSGVDHNTILKGFVLEFVKSENGNKISHIESFPMKILLVNTNVPRSTKKLVGGVKQLKENHPNVIECVLNAMENVAKDASKVLKEFKANTQEIHKLEARLGDLVTLNHNLLRVLGASHPALEQIVITSHKHNLTAKLTGAGGGGFGFIYLPSTVKTEVVKTIEKELTLFGFTVAEVTLGGPGLIIDELIY